MPIKSLQRESSSAVADSFFMEADDDALRRGDVAPRLPPPVPGVAGSGIATQPPTVAPFTPTVMAAFSALEAPVRTNTSVASEVSGMSLGGSPPPRPEGMDAGAQLPDIAPFTPAPSAAYGRRHRGTVGASAGLATDSMSLGGSPPPPSSLQMSLGSRLSAQRWQRRNCCLWGEHTPDCADKVSRLGFEPLASQVRLRAGASSSRSSCDERPTSVNDKSNWQLVRLKHLCRNGMHPPCRRGVMVASMRLGCVTCAWPYHSPG